MRGLQRLTFTRLYSACLIGVPSSKGQRRSGVEHGPEILRKHGIVKKLRKFNNVVDSGNIRVVEDIADDFEGNVKNPRTVGANNERIRDAVKESLKKYRPVISLGGDHSMAIGTISGSATFLGKAPVVIWVDAHADINPPELSPSGNLHGTPLSFLLKELDSSRIALPGFEWCDSQIAAKDIAFIGLRDVDPTELDIIKNHGIKAFDMNDIDRLGISRVLSECLDSTDPNGTRDIHLSFDVDALDPSLTPATGTPVRGGLFKEEGEFICSELARTGRLLAVDMVEVNPLLSDADGTTRTCEAAISLLQHCVGKRASPPFEREDKYVPEGSRTLN
ncbi:Oidioi.mRNA.OKI2018_I69.chr1.g1134.t1.cds [Oikopleura dioica]|uniref:Arginase n=1 Tax=Oikopleura dioica TaxID=34765 RepID=A0ABN7SLZ7_OIKDI|nr:Oidioi.mRNA.OKI2018_I69.chr1.g1134.t1.cds [Oikopleura dioica]